MRFKNQMFPYPTIQKGNGVYHKSDFKTKVEEPILENGRCKLAFELSVNNKDIQRLISEGKAAYAMQIECRLTYYRELITFSSQRYEHTLFGNQVEQKIELTSMIVAIQDIDDYSSDDLTELYDGETISFSKGDVLAVGEEDVVFITKELDSLKKLSSMFYVMPNPSSDAKSMSLHYESQQIAILLPSQDATRFQQCKNDPDRKEALFSALFFPALIAVIEDIKSGEGAGYNDSRWYIMLEQKSHEKELGSFDDWRNYSSLEIAQRLFDYPLTRYFKELAEAVRQE